MNQDNPFQEFDQTNHFQPVVDWSRFENSTGSSFLWEILEPLNRQLVTEQDEIKTLKRFSPGQKALHFFWYLDGQVLNGGYIQFYWNGFEYYLPAIKQALQVIGNQALLEQVETSEREYKKHYAKFEKWKKKDDWEWLYNSLTRFEELDDWYYDHKEANYQILEYYIRQNIDHFVKKVKDNL